MAETGWSGSRGGQEDSEGGELSLLFTKEKAGLVASWRRELSAWCGGALGCCLPWEVCCQQNLLLIIKYSCNVKKKLAQLQGSSLKYPSHSLAFPVLY